MLVWSGRRSLLFTSDAARSERTPAIGQPIDVRARVCCGLERVDSLLLV